MLDPTNFRLNKTICFSVLALMTSILMAILSTPLAAYGQIQDFQIEEDVDYFGGDYGSFKVPDGDLYACVSACRADNQCKAFTFGKAGSDRPQAVCWLKKSVPSATKSDCCVSGKKKTSALLISTGLPATQHSGLNYPGSDIKRLVLGSPDPKVCASACSWEKACKSYTYVKPGVQSPAALCYLKNTVPTGYADNCCTSGVKEIKVAELDDVSLTGNKNRAGRDYTNFNLKTPDPMICREACKDDAKCFSFTFVRPLGESPARCWLKDSAPAETSDQCCVSGAKTPETGLKSRLVRGFSSFYSKSCDSGLVKDAFDKLCSVFHCPEDNLPLESCSSYKIQVPVGSSSRQVGRMIQQKGAKAKSPSPRRLDGYGAYGGRGKILSDAAMCSMRELSPKFKLVGGGKGGAVVSGLAVSPISMGDFGYEHRIGYLNFDLNKSEFEGYRRLSFCAPVVGCYDAVAQDFTLTLNENAIDPPIYLGTRTPGSIGIMSSAIADKYYALTLSTETSEKSVTIETPSITVATPAGPITAQPEFSYESREAVIATPFAGGRFHTRPSGDRPGWDANVKVRDIYGADNGLAFPSYNQPQGHGWESQIALGNRDPRIERKVWSPSASPIIRPDFDLSQARSPIEQLPSTMMTADVEIYYPETEKIRDYIPSWVSAKDSEVKIWVKPTARAAFSGQFNIVTGEGVQSSVDSTGGDWRGADLSLQSNSAGSFSFSIGSGFDLKVVVDVLGKKMTVIDIHKNRLDVIGEGLTFQDTQNAYFASDYDPVSGGRAFSEFKTFKKDVATNSGDKAADYVAQCLADNQQVPREPPPEPVVIPGDPNELVPEEVEVPCNVCGYIPWSKDLQTEFGWTSAKAELFAKVLRPSNKKHWKCDGIAKNGCHDTCKLNLKSGKIRFLRGPDASDLFTNDLTGQTNNGSVCIPDAQVVK